MMYYKLARPDGWDFYTGKTINYREAINGPPVKAKVEKLGESPQLCSSDVLHACDVAEQCFAGATIPCSLYRVEGTPVVSSDDKHGFAQLKVLEELDPAVHFQWRYSEAASPINPFKLTPEPITDADIDTLRQWASVRNSAVKSVWDSIGNSAVKSVWESVWELVWSPVWELVWDSIRSPVRTSVWDSIDAYVGHIFTPVVSKWKYIDHKPGEYPFQPVVDLWMKGLVPSYNGNLWRLHGHEDARIIWEDEVK